MGPNTHAKKALRIKRPFEGAVYNLQELLEEISPLLPAPLPPKVSIGYGLYRPHSTFSSIRFGSYHLKDQIIRIHPLLDQKEVPLYFVRFVVYHEALHAVIPIRKAKGRRVIHGEEFHRWERAFPEYKEAIQWRRNSLHFFKNQARSRGRT